MDQSVGAKPQKMTEEEILREIDRMFVEMNRMDENIRRNHAESERLRKETRAILDALAAK